MSRIFGVILVAVWWVPAAHAQDFNDFDLSGSPDLVEVFRRHRPIMGDCPVGGVERDDATPPAEHLLHLGTTGFFLDYRRRLELTAEQMRELKSIRDDALARGAEAGARVAQLEGELWRATAGPAPDLESVRSQLEAISAAQQAQRWIYLDAVVRAAAVLTAEQRVGLVGRAEPK